MKRFFLLIMAIFLLVGCKAGEIHDPTRFPSEVTTLSTSATQLAAPISTETFEVPTKTSITSGPFRMVFSPIDVVTSAVESLISIGDGSLWLITQREIVKNMDDYLTVYLDNYSGNFAGVDSMERVWVVSDDNSQISAWDGNDWEMYDIKSGWTPLDVESSWDIHPGLSEFQGTLWLATSQDTRVFDGKAWMVFTRQDMGMALPIYDDLMPRFTVKVFENGTAWVGECDWGGPGPFGGGGVRWFENGTWRGETSPAASGCVNTIIDDSLGRVWIGVDSSLWRYDPASNSWEEFSPPESPIADMRFGFIDSLAVDSNNEAWAEMVLCGGASCYGKSVIYHLHDGEWKQIGSVGEYDSNYWGPVFDVHGIPWINWEGGIYRIIGDVPELVTSLDGRFGTRDSIGRVWFIAPYEDREVLWVLDDKVQE